MGDMESHECVTAHSTRVCKDCGNAKPLDSYYRQTGGTLFGRCKDCCKVRDRANYLKSKDRRLAMQAVRRVEKADELSRYRRDYYLKNRDGALAQMKEYRDRDDVKQRQAARAKQYYAERSTEIQAKRKDALLKDADRQKRWLEYLKRYYQENPHHYVEKAVRRRRAQDAATPAWADLKAIRMIYLMAARLTKETGIPHHVDHVIPLKGRNVCGLHVETNLQVLPAKANLSKANKLIEG